MAINSLEQRSASPLFLSGMPHNDPADSETASNLGFPGSATGTSEIWLLSSVHARPFGSKAASGGRSRNPQ